MIKQKPGCHLKSIVANNVVTVGVTVCLFLDTMVMKTLYFMELLYSNLCFGGLSFKISVYWTAEFNREFTVICKLFEFFLLIYLVDDIRYVQAAILNLPQLEHYPTSDE